MQRRVVTSALIYGCYFYILSIQNSKVVKGFQEFYGKDRVFNMNETHLFLPQHVHILRK